MSRGNVFKLSGNMALGGGSDYGKTDIEEIKNSLKLLKAKKNNREPEQYNGYGYGTGSSSIPTKNYEAAKSSYNYEALEKNFMPRSQKDAAYDRKGYQNEYSDPKSNTYQQMPRVNEQYDYSKKPPSYPEQNNTRPSRNNRNIQPETYDNIPTYQNKNQNSKNLLSQPRVPEEPSYKQKPTQSRAQQQQQQQKSKYEENTYYNDKEERSIKEVNRENQVDIVEYDPSELKACRSCGRTFNPDSIKKHEGLCNKVFQKKRKEFNTQNQRLVDNQQKKLMKQGEKVEKQIEEKQKNQKIPKWKAQSLAFRAGLKQTKNEEMDAKDMAIIQQAQEDSGVKCPHCGRKFNEQAGPRHIKFCEEQSRKNMMKKKK